MLQIFVLKLGQAGCRWHEWKPKIHSKFSAYCNSSQRQNENGDFGRCQLSSEQIRIVLLWCNRFKAFTREMFFLSDTHWGCSMQSCRRGVVYFEIVVFFIRQKKRKEVTTGNLLYINKTIFPFMKLQIPQSAQCIHLTIFFTTVKIAKQILERKPLPAISRKRPGSGMGSYVQLPAGMTGEKQ